MIAATESHVVSDAAVFVERFQAFWSSPHTVALDTILTADVRLIQPLTGATVGLPAAEA